MTNPVKRIYKEAKNNVDFQTELRLAGEENYSPSIFWDKTQKAVYASIYMGWLVAKGEYKESNYDY